MARIRSLKPGFFTNEHLAELPYEARLCFAGLWTLADREGRLEDRPRRIKAALFPYDDLDMDEVLNALQVKQFIVRYAVNGSAYIAIPTFRQHQRPKTDEYPSAIPAPVLSEPRGKALVPRPYKGDSGTEDSRTETEGSGADGAPLADGAGPRSETADGVDRFQDLWNTVTALPIPRCRDLTTKRRRHIRARLTERPWDEWATVLQRIQASRFCSGQNDRGWVATIDWVIGSPDVAVKVLEGKYDDRDEQKPVTAAELVHAKRVRDNSFGCPHGVEHSYQACLEQIAREIREKRAAS